MNLASTPLHKICVDKSSYLADETHLTAELTKDSLRKIYEQQLDSSTSASEE